MLSSRHTKGEPGFYSAETSFLGIVTTMIEQYAKFVKMALETRWRGDIAGLTYIETSTLWRQEHNGEWVAQLR
jgi:xylulose-5-phosphate/fructose-6-phosphate phosphoketolase